MRQGLREDRKRGDRRRGKGEEQGRGLKVEGEC